MLEQQTVYPRSDRVELHFAPKKPLLLSLKVRTPRWASGGLRFLLNGKPLPVVSVPGSYAEVRRTWRPGDVLQVRIPMSVRTEAMPDDANKVAFLYGPVVLAGDLGRVPEGERQHYAVEQWENFHKPVAEVPVLVTEAKDLASVVERMSGNDLVFRTIRTAQPRDVTLRPFNEIYYDYYNVYWDVLTPAKYVERKAALQAEAARRAALDARTIDEYRPGEQQSEVDHGQKGEQTVSGEWQGGKYRHAENGGWFSLSMRVAPDRPVELLCVYWGGENGNRTFDILVAGKVIATQTLHQDKPGQLFYKTYAIPEELTRGKQTIEVRFQAHPGNFAGGLYGAKVLKGRS